MNIKSKFKIFYRPNDRRATRQRPGWHAEASQSGGRLTVINPTPYFVSFTSKWAKHRRSGMVAPSARKW